VEKYFTFETILGIMPFKKGILLLIFCLYAVIATPQQLSHQVLVSAAGVVSPKASGTVYSYSQTIGEAMVEIVRNYDHVLTQGFQQPKLKITVGDQPQGTGVRVYPNPVYDYVTLELFGADPREFSVKIYNISGIVLFMDEATFYGQYWEKRRIPVSDLPTGFYIIRVESSDKKINRSFKMEKI
jgi:hypothetical protein